MLREHEAAQETMVKGLSRGLDTAGDMMAGNLIAAITRLQDDLERVELWAAVLECFLRPVPEYRPGDEYLLPSSPHLPSQKENGGS